MILESSKLKNKNLAINGNLKVRRLASNGLIHIYSKNKKKVNSLRKHWSTLIELIENGDDDMIIRNLIYLLTLILSKDSTLTKNILTENIFALIKKVLDQQKNKEIEEVCTQFIARLIIVEKTITNDNTILKEVKERIGYQIFFNLLYSSDDERRETSKELFNYLFSTHSLRQKLFSRDYLQAVIKAIRRGELVNSKSYLINNFPRRLRSKSPVNTVGKRMRTMIDFNRSEEYSKLQIGEMIALGASALIKRGTYGGKDVVIKAFDKLHISFSIKAFYTELLIMNHVIHPNIMPCIGACTKEDDLFIVMELIKIGSIYDLIHGTALLSAESRLPHLINLRQWSCFISIAKQISSGMAYLHSYHIIHRDLKSHNILLSDHTSYIGPFGDNSPRVMDYQVKLIDFGTCRDNDFVRHMTGGTGTTQWCAPEVLNHGIYNLSADVYSFGVVFWEMLTHQIPYNNMPIYKIANSVIHHNLRPSIPKNCPYFLRNLLSICWHENPERRPTFQQLVKDFDKFIKDLPSQSDRLPKLPLSI